MTPPTPPTAREARLTAHALGELPPDQAAAAEAALWADPAVREAVEEVRAVAESLTFSFAAEPQPTLTPAQQRALLAYPATLADAPEREARLTTFALGELRPSQHAAITALLESDRAARQWSEEVHALVVRVRREFGRESRRFLTLEQRDRVLARAAAATKGRAGAGGREVSGVEPVRSQRRVGPSWWRGAAAAAAGVALIGFAAQRDWESVTEPTGPVGGDNAFAVRAPAAVAANVPASRIELEPSFLALLAREEERPALSAVTNRTDSESGWSEGADAEGVAGVVAAAPAVVHEPTPFSPRPRPDESLLPPAAEALVVEPVAQKTAPRGRRLMASRPRLQVAADQGPAFLNTREMTTAYLPGMLGRAGYDIARQCVRDFGVLPPVSVVRPEEIVNHFDYDVQPAPGRELGIAVEAATCPWNERHQLVRVTVAGRDATAERLPALRLTYFIRLADTQENERLQLLLWRAVESLLPRLRPKDSLALAVWGRSHGIVLEPRSGWQHPEVRAAVEQLHRGGTPAGWSAWAAATALARRHFQAGALNRVIVVTDGPLDFDAASSLPRETALLGADGISVAVAQLGPRRSDASLPVGAFQADSSAEAARLFARDTIQPEAPLAHNVDIRLEFNPIAVRSWRPVGFDRPMAALASSSTGTTWRAGQQVTALYEVVPFDAPVTSLGRDRGRSARGDGAGGVAPGAPTPALSVHVRYDVSGRGTRQRLTTEWTGGVSPWRAASPDFRLAASAAAYALTLKADAGMAGFSLATVREITDSLGGHDEFGLRLEFATLVSQTDHLLGAR